MFFRSIKWTRELYSEAIYRTITYSQGRQTMHCKVCTRKAIQHGFCPLHLKAYKNIVEKYAVWRKALNISWEAYLSQIEENSLTGEWAKQVAKHLRNDGEKRWLKNLNKPSQRHFQ